MSGAIVYAIALMCERVVALFLLSFLVGDVSEPRFAIWTQFIGAIALLNVVIIVRLDNGLLLGYRNFQEQKLRAFLFMPWFP